MCLRFFSLITILISIIGASVAPSTGKAAGASPSRSPCSLCETPPYAIILLIDGARGDLIHELAAAGKLPNIQKLFIDGGLDVQKGLTVFPTTSTNAYQSFMTGLFPGHAGIPYLARYSRPDQESVEYLSIKGIKIMNADLLNWHQLNDPDTPYTTTQGSLFNHLADLRTASIYSTFRRDATLQVPGIPIRAAWQTFIRGHHEALDALAFQRLHKAYAGPDEKIPHLSLTAFLAVDILAHLGGSHSPRVLAHYETLDRMIGELWQLLEDRGIADRTYLVLVGDHGNHDISERSYLRERLIKRGIAIRSRHMRPPYELAINARGVSAAIISVAGKDGWNSRPTVEELRHVPTFKKQGGEVDLVDYLRLQPETDLLLVRADNHHVRIFNIDSEAELTRFWSSGRHWYSYRILSGTDPLHYADDPRLATLIAKGTPLTDRQWLPLTADKTYGDAIVQIGQIFTDGRVGDMMIVPKPDWVFRHEKANTHGGLSQKDIHIPIMMHGPGIRPQKIAYARSVDVMPTILAWFGKTTSHRDGQDLFHPDPAPTRAETALARIELKHLQQRVAPGGASEPSSDTKIPRYAPVTHASERDTPRRQDPLLKVLQREHSQRQARVDKLEAVEERCRTGKREDRLTRPDRPKKIRVSTCEVVDLALKTAYEDLQRLETITQ